MVDTQRNKDDFTNATTGIFKDNAAGDISAQDIRDFVESTHLNYGSLYFSTSATTNILSSLTWTKAAGTTTAVNLRGFDMPADNRLRYTGTTSVHVHGVISLSSSTVNANKDILYGVYYYDDSAASGSVLAHSILERSHGTSDIGAIALHFDQMLDTNDYVELHVQNQSDASDLEIAYGYIFMMGMFI